MAATTFHRELALAFARFLIPQAPPSLSDNLWDTFMNSPVALEIQKRNVDHVVHGVVFSERTTPVKKRAKAVAVPVADAAVPVADAAVPVADAAVTPKKKRKTAPSEPGAPKKPRQPSAKKAAAAAAAAAAVATVLESASPVLSTAAVADTESISDMDTVFSPELSGAPSLLNDLDTEAYDANEAVVEEFVEVYVDGVLFYQNKDATQFYDATYHPCPCPIH